MIDEEKFGFNVRTYEVIANIDVFGFPVVGIIGAKRFGPVVISADDEGRWTRKLELREGLSKPNSFLNCSGKCNVLGFSGGQGNAILLLG